MISVVKKKEGKGWSIFEHPGGGGAREGKDCEADHLTKREEKGGRGACRSACKKRKGALHHCLRAAEGEALKKRGEEGEEVDAYRPGKMLDDLAHELTMKKQREKREKDPRHFVRKEWPTVQPS